MEKLTTPLEVYRLLNKSNCRDCGLSTCMAFAAAVIKEEKGLTDCPHIAESVIDRFAGSIERQVNIESIQEESLQGLRDKVATVDLRDRAERLGARIDGALLVVPCLGRDFAVDPSGNVLSSCHTHAWFSLPLLDYVLHSAGEPADGRWVPFRELKEGRAWAPLFERRCERPLKEIADAHADLFGDLVTLFCGTTSLNQFSSDISVVLYPFPRVPVLLCYWKPEDGMESKLHVFFDATAEKNLPIVSLFMLGTGLAMMLEKITQKHAGVVPSSS